MHEDEPENGLAPHNVVDKVTLGRHIRALRILNGYDRVSDLVSVLRGKYGVDVSDRTVYAIERGEQMPHFDFIVALSCACETPTDYLRPAYRADVQALFDKRFGK